MRFGLFFFGLLIAAGEPQVSDLSFVAGAWKGAIGATAIEEHWTQPGGEAMLGMYREVKDGKMGMTELCSFERRGGKVVLLLRHFNAGLVAREEKDQPNVFELESVAPNRAVFLQTTAPTRLIYDGSSKDELVITLEKEKDGKKTSMAFRYRRMTPGI